MLSLRLPILITISTPSFHTNKPFFTNAQCTFGNNRNEPKLRYSSSNPLSKVPTSIAEAQPNVNDVKAVIPDHLGPLPGGLQRDLVPKHVAVIVDGHRRWAKNRGLLIDDGYRAGAQAIKKLSITLSKWGVQVITVFNFSTENWIRPRGEVDFLMSLLDKETLTGVIRTLIGQGMRVSFIGDKLKLPQSLKMSLTLAEEFSKVNTGCHLVGAINYSGQYDITQATKKIASKVKDGVLRVEDIDEKIFEQELETNAFPIPDLLIRTSGEQRLSNFMLWQMAYTELFFIDKLFPDIEETDLVEAVSSFQRRQRRYGGNKE